MGWFPDFCLSCDRQTTGATYCSQACRLTDLERASPGSEPISPLQRIHLEPWSSSTSSYTSSASPSILGFHLPPPVDFSSYRRARPTQAFPCSSSSFSSTSTTSTVRSLTAQSSTGPSAQWNPWVPSTMSRPDRVRNQREDRPSLRLSSSPSHASLVSLRSSSTPDEGHLSDEIRIELRAYASSFDLTRDLKQRLKRG